MASAISSRPVRLDKLVRLVHSGTELLDKFRFVFIPLAMCALIAVGAHAAADALGDVFLEWIDRAQGLFDRVVSSWSVTEGLVDLIGLTRRTQIARLSALLFELAADVLLAFPMLGFDERPGILDRARALFRRASERPAPISIARTLSAVALSFAGCNSVARLVHGAFALELRPWLGRSGWGFPRLIGLITLSWLIFAIASRSIYRALEQSDLKAQLPGTKRARMMRGLTGSLILLPLALVAALRAWPFDSFFH